MTLDLTSTHIALNVIAHFGAYGLWPVFYFTVLSTKWSNWTTFIVAWVVLPILDVMLGEDTFNLSKKEEKVWKKCIWFRVVTWFHTPLHVAGLTFAVWFLHNNVLTWGEYIGLIMGVGTICGFGIGCVHELIHRPSKFDWYLGATSLVFSMYSHFWIEHIWGHHRNVATPLDCASSELGDNVFWFVPRCIIKTFFDACYIEAKIMKEQKKLPWYHPSNRVFIGNLASCVVLAFYHKKFGWQGVFHVLLIGLITSWICDNTNYIEHYGLRRKVVKKNAKGEDEYEIVHWFHSWDTPAVLTNSLLFKIQRHPDHHTNAGRAYQILRTYPFAPQLPTGYAGCIVLSWFPTIWRWIMEPRIKLAGMYREEYEKYGTICGQKFDFPKERQAVSSHDPEADKIILGKKNFVDEDGKKIFANAEREGSPPVLDNEEDSSDHATTAKKRKSVKGKKQRA